MLARVLISGLRSLREWGVRILDFRLKFNPKDALYETLRERGLGNAALSSIENPKLNCPMPHNLNILYI